MKHVGIDVGRGSIICCVIEKEPPDITKFINTYKPIKISLTKAGSEKLLSLGDIYFLEPTGADYWPWIDILAEKEYYLVSGMRIRNFAKLNGIMSKGDREDAGIIALYGKTNLEKSSESAFLSKNSNEFKAYWNDLKRIPQLGTRYKNQIKGRLVAEAPHLAKIRPSDRPWGSKLAPTLWREIAGIPLGPRGKKREAIPESEIIGRGLSWLTQSLALQLTEVEAMGGRLEEEISNKIAETDDRSMRAFKIVFKAWGISDRAQLAILAAAYPLENFLREDGLPIRERRWNNDGTKQIGVNRSLKSFQRAMAHGQMKIQSGDSYKAVRTGDRSIYACLSMWIEMKCLIQRAVAKQRLLKRIPTNWESLSPAEQEQWLKQQTFEALFPLEEIGKKSWEKPDIVEKVMDHTEVSYRIAQLQLFYYSAPQNQGRRKSEKNSKTYSKFCRLLWTDLIQAYQDLESN